MLRRTEGHRLLAAWMKETGRGNSELGEALGVSRQAVSQWFSKNSQPDAVSRMILRTCASVPLEAWLTSEDLKRIEAAHQRLAHAA